tara:strand:- start:2414 stop:2881 length:468 start_codon:yes stop_codon:yes gene_type:complete
MKTYQIYVVSAEGTGTDPANVEYKFDWSIIPDGEYEMTYMFMSKALLVADADAQNQNVSTMIEIEVPFMTDRYKVSTNGYANSSNIAGVVYPVEIAHHSAKRLRQYRALATENAPVILRGKPQGNTFRVRTLQTHGEDLGEMFDYDLVINLKHIC